MYVNTICHTNLSGNTFESLTLREGESKSSQVSFLQLKTKFDFDSALLRAIETGLQVLKMSPLVVPAWFAFSWEQWTMMTNPFTFRWHRPTHAKSLGVISILSGCGFQPQYRFSAFKDATIVWGLRFTAYPVFESPSVWTLIRMSGVITKTDRESLVLPSLHAAVISSSNKIQILHWQNTEINQNNHTLMLLFFFKWLHSSWK